MKRAVSLASMILIAIVLSGVLPRMVSEASEGGITLAKIEIGHTHVGDYSRKGGCYNVWYDGCGQPLTPAGVDWNASSDGTWGLYRCPTGHTQTRSVVNAYGLHCQAGCGYRVNCGLSTGQTIATFFIEEQSGYVLHPSLSIEGGSVNVVSFTWQDGSVDDLVVSSNGTYTCTLTYTDNGVTRVSTLSCEVTDYDTEPPVIESVTGYESREKYHNIVVSATDNYGVTGYKIEKKQ